jgi:peptidoglycan-associated lipoprotein
MTGTTPRIASLAGAFAVVGLAACSSHIDQQTYEGDLAQLRDEMRTEIREGDEQVARRANQRIDALGEQLNAFTRNLRQLEEEFDAKINNLEAKVALDVPVHFEFDKAEIRPADRPALDRFAQVVQENRPDVLITVEGFADPSGPEAYNLWLGEQRAKAVKDYLVEKGLPDDRLRAVSYGEDRRRQVKPGAAGPGLEAMPNRRVAFVIEFTDVAMGSASGGE